MLESDFLEEKFEDLEMLYYFFLLGVIIFFSDFLFCAFIYLMLSYYVRIFYNKFSC